MEKYRIRLTKSAQKELIKLYKSGRKTDIEKVEIIFLELETTPRLGVGNPEQLKHYDGEVWSRRINKKDRIIYEIYEREITISVFQVLGHYYDK